MNGKHVNMHLDPAAKLTCRQKGFQWRPVFPGSTKRLVWSCPWSYM